MWERKAREEPRIRVDWRGLKLRRLQRKIPSGVYRRKSEGIRHQCSAPKNWSRGASLRGQGTPADPARLRSVRARNPEETLLPQAGLPLGTGSCELLPVC